MIKHVVLFKFDDKKEIDIVKEKLMSMKGKIDELKHIEVGINFVESKRNFDICLITHFDTKEDLVIYNDHPVHIPIKEYIFSVISKMGAVDYEI